MSHVNHHSHKHTGRALLISTVLNFSISIAQLIGGIISNSLSLISDSVHNLGDASAIFGAYIANRVGQRNPSKTKTYGYRRAEIITAFINALVLISISVYLTAEAISRLQSPEQIDAKLMLIVATAGLLINLISVLLLQNKRKGNLNVKAAYLHLMSDTFSSIAVILGALAMHLWNIFWLDPVLTVLVNILILKHAYHILKESLDVLMQGVPKHLNIADIKEKIEEHNMILNAHHIHVWSLDGTKILLECHIEFKKDIPLSVSQQVFHVINTQLKKSFHIHHVTLQAEFESNHYSSEIETSCR